jgi:hypothetical protein
MNVVAADCINVHVKDNNGNPRANVAVNLDYYWMQGTTNGLGICLSIITHLINTGVTNYWYRINV